METKNNDKKFWLTVCEAIRRDGIFESQNDLEEEYLFADESEAIKKYKELINYYRECDDDIIYEICIFDIVEDKVVKITYVCFGQEIKDDDDWADKFYEKEEIKMNEEQVKKVKRELENYQISFFDLDDKLDELGYESLFDQGLNWKEVYESGTLIIQYSDFMLLRKNINETFDDIKIEFEQVNFDEKNPEKSIILIKNVI